MKRTSLIIISILATIFMSLGQTRSVVTLEKGWKFTREDNPQSKEAVYDDSNWESVRVPHDWAIYGPFDKSNDIHHMAIVQDGQTSAIEHYGRTGGLPFTGAGWYRINFTIPEFSDSKRVTVKFDGAMSNARVYVNGKEAGFWPYGYNTFYFDITDLLNDNGRDNTLAVRLENLEEGSRWYPGAGLYRNVHIITTNDSHIPVWGTYITTPEVNDEFAKVDVKTKVVTAGEDYNGKGVYKLVTEILDGDAKLVSSTESVLTTFDQNEFSQTLILENPKLWEITVV
jgi:beta-galactosidase